MLFETSGAEVPTLYLALLNHMLGTVQQCHATCWEMTLRQSSIAFITGAFHRGLMQMGPKDKGRCRHVAPSEHVVVEVWASSAKVPLCCPG